MAQSELLAGEVAVVTGAASGTGRAIALTFANEGADVVVADVNESPLMGGVATNERIREETDASAAYVECDVSNVDDVYEAVASADQFGGVTVMVNNAGITESKSFLDTTKEEYDTMMDINTRGMFFGAQAAAKSMLDKEREGKIINISSTSGLYGRGDGVSYCTSKGGVKLMTYALADALAPDIRVNAVHPDFTDTAMTRDGFVDPDTRQQFFEMEMPLGRAGEPTEIANCVLFLASDLSSFVTGHSLVVDGGVTATK